MILRSILLLFLIMTITVVFCGQVIVAGNFEKEVLIAILMSSTHDLAIFLLFFVSRAMFCKIIIYLLYFFLSIDDCSTLYCIWFLLVQNDSTFIDFFSIDESVQVTNFLVSEFMSTLMTFDFSTIIFPHLFSEALS